MNLRTFIDILKPLFIQILNIIWSLSPLYTYFNFLILVIFNWDVGIFHWIGNNCEFVLIITFSINNMIIFTIYYWLITKTVLINIAILAFVVHLTVFSHQSDLISINDIMVLMHIHFKLFAIWKISHLYLISPSRHCSLRMLIST